MHKINFCPLGRNYITKSSENRHLKGEDALGRPLIEWSFDFVILVTG